MDERFTDMLLRIRKGGRTGYRVEAWLGDGSFYEGDMHLTAGRRKDLELYRDRPEPYGCELFGMLFDDAIGTAYDVATGLARQGEGGVLRVRIFLDEDVPDEIHALKWERLTKPSERPLAVSTSASLARYIALSQAEKTPLDDPVVKLLFVISAPSDTESGNLARIVVEQEVRRLFTDLRQVWQSRRCKVTLMPGQSGLSDELKKTLRDADWDVVDGSATLDAITKNLRGKHVLHFLGHGKYLDGEGRLVLEDDEGKLTLAEQSALVDLLPKEASLRLIFLAACESARGSDLLAAASPSGHGLAASLVHAGIPAVIAMQEPLGIDAAYHLASEFYYRLFLEHGFVDRALNEARAALFDSDQEQWAVPVLFMRLKDGQIARPNPVWLALAALREHRDFVAFAKRTYIDLPVEAVLVSRGQNPQIYEQQEVQSVGTVDVVQTSLKHLGISHKLQPNPASAAFVLILGGPGASKSMLIRRIGWDTLRRPPAGAADDQFIPLYLDLQEYRPDDSGSAEGLESQVLNKLRGIMPEATAGSLKELWDNRRVRLRVLFNAGDTLPEAGRDIVRLVAALAATYPHHQYVLAVQPGAFSWSDLAGQPQEQLCILAVQPLTRRGIRHLLETADGYGAELLNRLYDSSLFDLASTPYFITAMIAKARQQQFTESRAVFLQQIIDEAINQIPPQQGMRANAARTLYRMAWTMQQKEIEVWPVVDVFREMNDLRGERGYAIEDMYAALVRQKMLLAVGEDALRFSYGSIKGHCCAEAILVVPDRDRILLDLVSSLGSPARVNWWEETLVAASGLLAADGSQAARHALDRLLRAIVYGADLLEGKRVFLAARCLLECRSTSRGGRGCPDELKTQVVDALRWRADSAFEPDLSRRLQATQLLAQLGMPEIAIGLAAKAYGRVRKNVADQWDYEFSTVRYAAAVALKRMRPDEAEAVLAQTNPRLVDLFRAWQAKDLDALIRQSMDGTDPGVQGLTALALGDLQGPLDAGDMKDGARTLDRLVDMFLSGETPQAVRWSVADALSLVDVSLVTEALVNPLLKALDSPDAEALAKPAKIRKTLAYLIGLLRLVDPKARDYLVRNCLGLEGEQGSKDWSTWATAIVALGRIAAESDKKLLAEIASGKAGGVDLKAFFIQETERNYVRREAINALANQADLDVLTPESRASIAEEPALAKVYFQAAPEIYWRNETVRGVQS